jgi:hypothetical protein
MPERIRPPIAPHPCASCGQVTTKPKFCSTRCNSAEKYRRDLASGAERSKMDRRNAGRPSTARTSVSRPCERCGAKFVVSGRAVDIRRFCSRSCARRSRPVTPGCGANGGHRRRARQYGCQYETGLSWRLLLVEDGPACWLCDGDVDPTDKRRSGGGVAVGRRYPSLDHVIPLARGGQHVRDNVRMAHMGCNTARGAPVAA